MVKQRIKNGIRDVKTLPGSDLDTDHKLQVAEVQIRSKAIKKAGKRKQKLNLERIKSN
jgi:hypothetical protein